MKPGDTQMKLKMVKLLKLSTIIIGTLFVKTVLGTDYYTLNESNVKKMKTLYAEDITLNTVQKIEPVNPDNLIVDKNTHKIIIKKFNNGLWPVGHKVCFQYYQKH